MTKKRVLICSELHTLNTGYSNYSKELLYGLASTGKYEVAEYATYLSADEQRPMNVPWKIYPSAPAKNSPERQQFDADPSNVFGKYWFEKVCLDFKATHVCFPPKSLVFTENGHKPIEDVVIGEKTLTHLGRFKPVVKLLKNEYKGKLISIKFNGCKQPLKLTPDHPVLVFKSKRQTNQKKSIKKIYANETPVFVAAKNISKKDLICLPRYNTNNELTVDLCDYIDEYLLDNNIVFPNRKHESYNGIKRYISCKNEFGRFLGYLLTDGCIQKYTVSFTFTGDEQNFADDLLDITYNLFGIKGTAEKYKDKFAINVSFYSKILSDFLYSFCNTNKSMPNIVWNSNEDFIKGLICGLVRGDGCYKKNTISFCSIVKKLAHDYRLLCNILGIESNVQHRYTKKTSTGDIYEVETYGEPVQKLHDIVQKEDAPYDLVEKAVRRPRSTHFVNSYLVASVSNISSEDYDGCVYNLEVKDDNSYVIEQACVHNCDIRDFWMLDYEGYSSFRPYYNLLWMPACDAEPQNEQWLYSYSQADGVFSYSDWGANLLKNSSAGKINVLGSASPCSPKEYMPLDTNKCKQHMKIPTDSYILGTVMRNQRRKLYPELFESFRTFLDESKRSDIYLYCHTSYPDYGWDFPYLLKYHGITNRVLFTYKCKSKECGYFGCNHFSDAATICPKCHQLTYCLPNVKDGLNHAEMAVVYNSMDLYVQYANCMPAGQKVLLKSGWTNIEEVKSGDIAYTHTGKWQKVTQKFKKKNNNDIHEISVHGDSEKIRLTAEHPVYAITAKNSNYNRKHTSFRERLGELLRKGKKLPEPQFVDSKDLLPGDMLVYPINKNVVDITEIDLTEYCDEDYIISENYFQNKYSKVAHERKIVVDLDFCKWIGLFVADGSWSLGDSVGNVKITSHIDEFLNHNLCLDVMSKFGNVGKSIYKDKNAKDYRACNKVFTKWISQQCLKHELKKLPDWTMELPLDKQSAILHGLFMGDGHYQEKQKVSIYVTISEVLSFQIKEILRRLGIVYNMRLVIKEGNRKPQYRFEIPGNVKIGEFSSKRNSTASMNTGEYYLFKIKSNAVIDEDIDYVYNFEVENDNSYCSLLGIVHNCEGFGMPCVEAAACGTPLTVVNYSAMCDFVNKLNAMPIEPIALYTELETGCKRAIPDNKQLIQNLKTFFNLPKAMQLIKRQSVRDAYLRNYNYEWTVKKWADAIDSIDNALPWNSPSRFKHPNTNVPPNLNNSDFTKWIIVNVLGDSSKLGSYLESRISRDLCFGYRIGGQPGTYFNEDSEKFNRTPFAPFNREIAIQEMLYFANKRNHFETLRIGATHA